MLIKYTNMLAIITVLNTSHTLHHGTFAIYSGTNGASYHLKDSIEFIKISPNLKVTRTDIINDLKYLCS